LEKHRAEICKERMCECPYHEHGCNERIKYKHLQRHLEDKKLSHFELKTQNMEKKIQRLESENQKLKSQVAAHERDKCGCKEAAKDQSASQKKRKMHAMSNGIKYRDMRVGDGQRIRRRDKVQVYYVGQTEDKEVFNKCLSGPGYEFSFGVGKVIKGWDEGLEGMRVGGKRKLVIPPCMAVGTAAPRGIPPNPTYLTFTIEIKSVRRNVET